MTIQIHLEVTKTQRGFVLAKFRDRYGVPCSVQESSLADEECIWLGTDSDRMHLTRAMALALASVLTEFGNTGRLFDTIADSIEVPHGAE